MFATNNFASLPAATFAVSVLAASSPLPSDGWGATYASRQLGTANSAPAIYPARAVTASLILLPRASAVEVATPWLELVEEIRLGLGATVNQIASALGVSRQAVYGWMRGEKGPKVQHQGGVQTLCAASRLLRERLGPQRLGVALSFPIGADGETFWDLVSQGQSPIDIAEALLVAVHEADERRRALTEKLDAALPSQPIDW